MLKSDIELTEKELIKKAEIILPNEIDELDLSKLDDLTELSLENYSSNSFKLYLEGGYGSLALNLDSFSGAIVLDLINCSKRINLSLSVYSPLTNLTLNNCDNLAVLDIEEECKKLKTLDISGSKTITAELEASPSGDELVVNEKKFEQIEELKRQKKALEKEFEQITEELPKQGVTFQFRDYLEPVSLEQFVAGGLILVIFYSFLYYFDDLTERELRVRGGHYSKNVLLEKFRGLPLEEKQRYQNQVINLVEKDAGTIGYYWEHLPNHFFHSGAINHLSGKNGTGKTTLLYLLLGMLTPEKGEIVIVTEKRDGGEENYVLHCDLNLQR
ncbi:20130_t:CDS:2 [Cetraspora pellucida]|uniref:20130_t:CDS:1 n=1 Tax=Cetraspora pellucida TaxID=1433469 RepID=A0A9N8W6P8_9GLOM|nr:20130_t:CDS:2 [Cetraspora pellucida]